ncbi:methyltransferase domain-containing protein [Burkholderia multivorans]|uniref:Methyltransferase domain-containing protein n=1 Tax=Burkholderia multivorans TaxID=87883 RepID=A0AAP2HP65_9BURK|nr:class I SAM-dependent methyltransferase [Burkholderia multivorans]MBU9360038.1 methyltransferase domain-containing protein [Burkholderia multivorans]
MSLLDEWAEMGLLLCPETRKPLTISPDGTYAEADGHRWSIKNGVLDLYGKYSPRLAQINYDPKVARDVATSLSLPHTEEVLAVVADAISDTYLVSGDNSFSAENADLLDRLGITDHHENHRQEISSDANKIIHIEFENTFIEPVVKTSSLINRSVRIRNAGPVPIASTESVPLAMSYHWLDVNGTVVVWDGLRTNLPIELAAGESLTLICRIQTPPEPGIYRLQFHPIIEGKAWLEGSRLTRTVVAAAEVSPTISIPSTGEKFNYADDHQIGMSIVRKHVTQARRNSRLRLLEIGSGIHPQAATLIPDGCDLISIDISSPQGQLGRAHFDYLEPAKAAHIAFITCDAHAPPFPSGTFDGIVIFSALHHFSDPVKLLRNLRTVMKPGAFVAIMCEPCAPNKLTPQYFRDLEKGINEQCWDVQEYAEIFIASGFHVVDGRQDDDSLKVILEESRSN